MSDVKACSKAEQTDSRIKDFPLLSPPLEPAYILPLCVILPEWDRRGRENRSNVEGLESPREGLVPLVMSWDKDERERDWIGSEGKDKRVDILFVVSSFLPRLKRVRACTRTCSLPCCISGLLSARCARSLGKSAFVCVYVLKSFCGMRMPGRVRWEGRRSGRRAQCFQWASILQ